MIIKPQEISIPTDDPFRNCQLERKKHADNLESLLRLTKGDTVIAITGKWGSGKTTFIRMLRQQLNNGSFRTSYFNAWSSDTEDSPRVAILSEIQAIGSGGAGFQRVLELGAKIWNKAVPELVVGIIKKHIVDGEVYDAIARAVSSVSMIESDVNEYREKQSAIAEFKASIGEYIEESCIDEPVVFFIDELDRCRPDYAVKVLEEVKHFFNVPGIVFVLAVDKKHLCSSIKGFYGSNQIDATEYLRRFIDWEYEMPQPNRDQFVNYLFQSHGIPQIFSTRIENGCPRNEYDELLFIATQVVEQNKLELRQIEKVMTSLVIALRGFEITTTVMPSVLFYLIYLRVMKEQVFKKILVRSDSIGQVALEFFDSVLRNNDESIGYSLEYIMASLLTLYNNYLPNSMKIELLLEGGQLNPKAIDIINFNDGTRGDISDELAKSIRAIKSAQPWSMANLGFILEKIEFSTGIRPIYSS